MTKQHFEAAAEQVKAILDGKWTGELPSWSPLRLGPEWEVDAYELGNVDRNIVRAVQTAESYILLFKQFNPRFDEQRFLQACGLVPKPKRGRE